MAFTERNVPVSRYEYFSFYATGAVSMNESLSPTKPFELTLIRLRLSTAHVSDIDFMVTMSSILGSYYNQNILSTAMVGVRDVLHQIDPPIVYHYGDTLELSMIMSAANVYGVEVCGWSITA